MLFLSDGLFCFLLFATGERLALKRDGADIKTFAGISDPNAGWRHSWKRHLRTPNMVIGRKIPEQQVRQRRIWALWGLALFGTLYQDMLIRGETSRNNLCECTEKENCYFEQKPGQSFIFKKKYSKHSGRAYSKELQRTSKLHSMSAKPLLFPFHIRFWVMVSSIVAALSKCPQFWQLSNHNIQKLQNNFWLLAGVTFSMNKIVALAWGSWCRGVWGDKSLAITVKKKCFH